MIDIIDGRIKYYGEVISFRKEEPNWVAIQDQLYAQMLGWA